MYCERSDIETLFGRLNTEKWADLDNQSNATDIAARIASAIAYATSVIDSRLFGSQYDIPIIDSDTYDVDRIIIDLCATLAGVWLYEARGIADVDPDTGQAIHRLTWHRKRAEDTIRRIRAGQIQLVADRNADSLGVPSVVKECDDE
jgi:hypothetical protein